MHHLRVWLHRHPAWVLFVIAPILAEVFSGSTPLNEFIMPFTALSLMMLYGSGAVLAREAVRRWNKGWVSLLLLGFAYGIYEEGLVVRSFFDPHWIDLGNLGAYGRVAGVNWVWTEQLLLVHASISIMTTITFVEILFPDRRHEPWLRGRLAWGFHLFNLLAVLALGRALVPYDAPDGWVAVCWLSILALIVLARLWPSSTPSLREGKAAHPRAFFLLGMGGIFLLFFVTSQGADAGRYPYPVAMALLALDALLVLWLARRWSGNGLLWDDRHRLALLNGVLSFFLIITALLAGSTYPVIYVTSPLFLLGLAWLYHRVAHRTAAAGKSPEAASRL